MTDLIVRVKGLVFRGFSTSPANGFFVEKDGWSGWDDGIDVRRDIHERPQSHGSFDVPAFLDSRDVTLRGFCVADSPEQLGWMRSQVTGLMAEGGNETVVVENQGLVTWARGGLGAQSKFQQLRGGQRTARLQLQFWFADPRKFGETRLFAAGVPAHHFGNFPATPVHTITGVGSGYTINGPDGRAFTVTKPVTDGHPHTVDMATGFLSVDGVVVSGAVTSADTWAIPGGAQVTHTLTGSGLTLSTAVTDTYI